jgi:alpha-acetolactate decarboxylase
LSDGELLVIAGALLRLDEDAELHEAEADESTAGRAAVMNFGAILRPTKASDEACSRFTVPSTNLIKI